MKMNKVKLDVTKEALVLYYLKNYRGRTMKGEARQTMYEVYQLFKNDGRDASVCTCLDRDTHNKVDGFINEIEWSQETLSSPTMQEVLPHLYIEPIVLEEESTQPVDMDEVLSNMKIRTTIPPEDMEKAKAVPVKPQKRKPRTTKK